MAGTKNGTKELEQHRLQLPKHWQIIDELIYYKNRLFIPNSEELQTQITKECHDSQIAGHFGQEKTIEIVSRDFLLERTNCMDKRLRTIM